MAYHNSSHGSSHGGMYDKDIKEGMSRGRTNTLAADIPTGKQAPDKFASSVGSYGFTVIKDAGMAHSYAKRAVSSSPMMRPATARKSWRSTGQYSRADRSG